MSTSTLTRTPTNIADQRLIAIGLGGNDGDVTAAFRAGIHSLLDLLNADLVAVSSLYRTKAIGPGTNDFLNAAAVFTSEATPQSILAACHQVETEIGRERKSAWSNRPIDVDILLAGDLIEQSPQIIIPHPRLCVRRFAIDPLAEIAGDTRHPLYEKTIADIANHWTTSPLRVDLRTDQITRPAKADLARWSDRVVLSATPPAPSHAEPHVRLTFQDVDNRAWPPEVDLRTWPLSPAEAIVAAIDGLLDQPIRQPGRWFAS